MIKAGLEHVKESGKDFVPRIVGYCCQYCAYAAADLACNLRLQYPANVRIVLVPCSGRVSEVNLLQTFEEGVDGVFVAGCRPGDCHFIKGNLEAARRVHFVKLLLEKIGMGGDRLDMYNLSSSEAQRFVEIAAEMTERIILLGPSPLLRPVVK